MTPQQARRLHIVRADDDDAYDGPPTWVGITVALVLGVLLLPLVWRGAWGSLLIVRGGQ